MAHGLSGFAGGAVAAAKLWCEYAVDPLGIDVAEPRFSWILGSERRGQVQSAYRILELRVGSGSYSFLLTGC